MKLLAIAGEPSGDAHGGPLLRELILHVPDLALHGIGGPLMQAAGLRPLRRFSDLQVHGLVEVVRHLPRLFRVLAELEAWLDRERPDAVLLIDYPGFNLKVAAAARVRGIPVLWYSSPQIWAWRGGRLKTIARVVSKIIVLFPFEVEIYRKAGLDAEFLGHPLVGLEAEPEAVEALRARIAAPPGKPIVGVMPGSRTSELRRNLPPILAGIGLMRQRGFDATFVLPLAPSLDRAEVEALVSASGQPVRIEPGAFLPLLKLADMAVVASGTATLQVGLAGIPFVVVYRVSPLTHWIAKRFAYIKHISIVNILAGREIAPELLQYDFTPERLCETLLALAADPEWRSSMRHELSALAGQLGQPGAYARAAGSIARYLREHAVAAPPR